MVKRGGSAGKEWESGETFFSLDFQQRLGKLVEMTAPLFFPSSLPFPKGRAIFSSGLHLPPGPEIEPSPPSDPFISASRGDPVQKTGLRPRPLSSLPRAKRSLARTSSPRFAPSQLRKRSAFPVQDFLEWSLLIQI
jgi:hypothetical protein